MEFICHRVNDVEMLKHIPHNCGVEIDLRDNLNGQIYLEHDPFKQGGSFETYLQNYHHGTMILNIKSERVELKALELLQKYTITDYFFLDSSFPMIKLLTDRGEKNIALRYSELEGMDTIRNMKGKINWIWIDCFSKFPLSKNVYFEMKKMGLKLCLVSPELQGQDEKIEEYSAIMKEENMILDAICCKDYNIKRWQCCQEEP